MMRASDFGFDGGSRLPLRLLVPLLLLLVPPACSKAEGSAAPTPAAKAASPEAASLGARGPAADSAAAVGKGAEAKESPWAEHIVLTAGGRAGGTLTVTVEGKDGWYVNTAYPGLKVELTPPKGLELARTTLDKAAVRFDGTHEGDKAERASWEVPVSGGDGGVVSGRYKMVICSASTCSPPFEGHFEAKIDAPAG